MAIASASLPQHRRASTAVVCIALWLVGCGGSQSNNSAQNNASSSGGNQATNDEPDAGAEPALEESTARPAPSATAGPEASVVATADAAAEAAVSDEDPALARNVVAPPARPAMNGPAAGSYRSGLEAAQRGDLAAAFTQFQGALNNDPRAFAAAYNAGVISERQGNDAQADSLYQRALSIQPDYELAVVARARLLVRTRRVTEAVTMAADVARRFPGNFSVRAEYARLLVSAQRYPDAIEEARAILRLDERNVGAKIAIAEAYRAQGRLDLSLYIVDDLINGSDPDHPNNGPGTNDARAHYLRALLRLEVNRDVPGAIESFRRATELDPQFAEAHNNLGVYLLQAGNSQSAVEHLRAAVALSPSWAKAHLNLGDALRATHEYDAAIAELNRAQQLDGTLSEVHYNFGRLYAEQARGVESRGLDNLNRKLGLLERSQQSFTRFRDALGPSYGQHPRHDDVEQQLARLTDQIQRTTRARDREQRNAQRGNTAGGAGAARPAPSAAPSAATPSATPAAEPSAAPPQASPSADTSATPSAAPGEPASPTGGAGAPLNSQPPGAAAPPAGATP